MEKGRRSDSSPTEFQFMRHWPLGISRLTKKRCLAIAYGCGYEGASSNKSKDIVEKYMKTRRHNIINRIRVWIYKVFQVCLIRKKNCKSYCAEQTRVADLSSFRNYLKKTREVLKQLGNKWTCTYQGQLWRLQGRTLQIPSDQSRLPNRNGDKDEKRSGSEWRRKKMENVIPSIADQKLQ